jgi:hypothetical protein
VCAGRDDYDEGYAQYKGLDEVCCAEQNRIDAQFEGGFETPHEEHATTDEFH